MTLYAPRDPHASARSVPHWRLEVSNATPRGEPPLRLWMGDRCPVSYPWWGSRLARETGTL